MMICSRQNTTGWTRLTMRLTDWKGLMDDKLPHRDGREVEFADCIIRILDTAAALGLDVAGAVIEKNRFNAQRADHKLAVRAAGGKRY